MVMERLLSVRGLDSQQEWSRENNFDSYDTVCQGLWLLSHAHSLLHGHSHAHDAGIHAQAAFFNERKILLNDRSVRKRTKKEK